MTKLARRAAGQLGWPPLQTAKTSYLTNRTSEKPQITSAILLDITNITIVIFDKSVKSCMSVIHYLKKLAGKYL
jgi:hypothetical protein